MDLGEGRGVDGLSFRLDSIPLVMVPYCQARIVLGRVFVIVADGLVVFAANLFRGY